MSIRVRNTLIDNTVGTLYSGIITTDLAVANNTLATIAAKNIPFQIKAPGATVTTVTDTIGWTVNSPTIVSQVKMDMMKVSATTANSVVAPSGSSIITSIRKVSNTGTTTVLGTTNVASGSISSTTAVNYSLNTYDTVYIDVTQVGSTFAGSGLRVTLSFYGG